MLGKLCGVAVLLGISSAAAAAGDEEHAHYLAQRYAMAGDLKRAAAALANAQAVPANCPVVVKLKTADGIIPICAPSRIGLPAPVRAKLEALLTQAGSAAGAQAVALLEEARMLDPFDARVTSALARVLRTSGREADARKVEAEAEALHKGRTVLKAGLWAGSTTSGGERLLNLLK